jgi:type IV secretory pathway VirB2 component (pilin)
MMRQMSTAMADFLQAAQGWIQISESRGPDEMADKIVAMLDGDVNAQDGIILRP